MNRELSNDSEPQELFEKGVDFRLAACALTAWVGVLTGLQIGLHGGLALPVLTGVGAVSLVVVVLVRWLAPRHLVALARTLIVVAALAFGVGGLVAAKHVSDPVTVAAEQGEFVTLTLEVNTHPDTPDTPFGRDTRTFKASATGILEDGTWVPARADLWVSLGGFDSPLKTVPVPGETLRASGALAAQDWLAPPYAGSFKAASFKRLAPAPPWQVASSYVRAKLREAVTPAGINAPLIRGMAIGDDAGLPKRTKEAMLTSSLTHLTAVSGSHIALSIWVIAWLLRGRPRVQEVASGLFLLVIAVLVGPEPSVIRACVMGGLALWALFRRRPSQPLALLGATVLVSTLLDPWLAVSVGFVLSVFATAGIVLGARPMERWLARLGESVRDALASRLPRVRPRRNLSWEWSSRLRALREVSAKLGSRFVRAFGAAVSVAVVAQLATLPALTLINPWLPTWGVIANLLVAPAVAPLTLLGLGVAATATWAPALASTLAWAASPFAAWVRIIAEWVASWPLARLPWPQGPTGAALAIALTAAGLLVAHWLSDLRRGR